MFSDKDRQRFEIIILILKLHHAEVQLSNYVFRQSYATTLIEINPVVIIAHAHRM